MSLDEAEIPDRRPRPESLGPVSRLNRRLYFAVIVVLGAVLLIGVLGWLLLAADGKSMPDGLGVILGTVAGALVALVSDGSKR
jgi:hypothetical protein